MALAIAYRVAVLTAHLALATSSSVSDVQAAQARITRAHVETTLIKVLVGTVAGERSTKVEAALRPIYDSLPKNEHGKLAQREASDAIFRMFTQRHGLVVKGLGPEGGSQEASSVVLPVAEWVPRYLQDQIEKRTNGQGMGLLDVSVMAVTLEKLILEHVPKEQLQQETWFPSTEDVLLFIAAFVVVLGLYAFSPCVRNALSPAVRQVDEKRSDTDTAAEPPEPSAGADGGYNWVLAFFGFGALSVAFDLLDMKVFAGVMILASATLVSTKLMPEQKVVGKKCE